jgi:hypothetical protein
LEFAVSVGVYFGSEGQNSPPSADIIGQVVTSRHISLLFNGEIDNDQCDVGRVVFNVARVVSRKVGD